MQPPMMADMAARTNCPFKLLASFWHFQIPQNGLAANLYNTGGAVLHFGIPSLLSI